MFFWLPFVIFHDRYTNACSLGRTITVASEERIITPSPVRPLPAAESRNPLRVLCWSRRWEGSEDAQGDAAGSAEDALPAEDACRSRQEEEEAGRMPRVCPAGDKAAPPWGEDRSLCLCPRGCAPGSCPPVLPAFRVSPFPVDNSIASTHFSFFLSVKKQPAHQTCPKAAPLLLMGRPHAAGHPPGCKTCPVQPLAMSAPLVPSSSLQSRRRFLG